jgi:hypothetical protein
MNALFCAKLQQELRLIGGLLADHYHIGEKDEIFATIWYFRMLTHSITDVRVQSGEV